jgi:hypothetical protein
MSHDEEWSSPLKEDYFHWKPSCIAGVTAFTELLKHGFK